MKRFIIAAVALMATMSLSAQQSWVNETHNPQANTEGLTPMGARVISPEVHDDHTVTFRLYAPNAQRVVVSGSMFTGGMEQRNAVMTKDDKGVWSVTAGPFTPDVYTYTFNIDGLSVIDPSNTLHNHGTMPASSMLYLHNDKPAYYDPNPEIPHGAVTTNYYYSPVSEGLRSIVVYTPPQYNPKKKYPVLYLMGGSGEAVDSWYKYGQVNWIMDNMIAEGKIEPTIVAMVNNQIVHRNNPKHSELSFKMMEREYLEVVIPWVDANYSTIKKRDGRALAGLSMGGGHTATVSRDFPGTFDYVGVYSGAVGSIKDREGNLNQDMVNKLKAQQKAGYKLYWIACGNTDFLYQQNLEYMKGLDEIGFKYTWFESEGGHTWDNWRMYLDTFAPMLFK